MRDNKTIRRPKRHYYYYYSFSTRNITCGNGVGKTPTVEKRKKERRCYDNTTFIILLSSRYNPFVVTRPVAYLIRFQKLIYKRVYTNCYMTTGGGGGGEKQQINRPRELCTYSTPGALAKSETDCRSRVYIIMTNIVRPIHTSRSVYSYVYIVWYRRFRNEKKHKRRAMTVTAFRKSKRNDKKKKCLFTAEARWWWWWWPRVIYVIVGRPRIAYRPSLNEKSRYCARRIRRENARRVFFFCRRIS